MRSTFALRATVDNLRTEGLARQPQPARMFSGEGGGPEGFVPLATSRRDVACLETLRSHNLTREGIRARWLTGGLAARLRPLWSDQPREARLEMRSTFALPRYGGQPSHEVGSPTVARSHVRRAKVGGPEGIEP